jgi:hypothetical protein
VQLQDEWAHFLVSAITDSNREFAIAASLPPL